MNDRPDTIDAAGGILAWIDMGKEHWDAGERERKGRGPGAWPYGGRDFAYFVKAGVNTANLLRIYGLKDRTTIDDWKQRIEHLPKEDYENT